jgi:molybdopterin-binding protein
MSKKLIAVVAAAALALTGLVATPANATTISNVKINKDNSAATGGTETVSHTGTTSVSPVTYASSRTWDWADTGSTTRNVVRFDVTTSAATTVTVSSTLGVKVSSTLTDAAGDALKVTDGSQSISITTTSTNLVATFYALNTSTTAGKVSIATPGSLSTYNVKGVAGTPYALTSVKFPTTVTSGAAEADGAVISFQVADAYGNLLDTANLTDVTTAALGATVSAETYSTVRKQYEAVVFGTATSSVALSLSLAAADLSANGFAKPTKSAFATISGADLATQVTTLTAQVATLTTAVATLTTDYNALATKYNKLVKKSKRVAKK